MRVLSVASACVLATALGGCAIFADPNAWPQKFKYGDSATLASGAGIRYVNERNREMTGREDAPLPTMCTEPSPDVAIAFGTSLGGSVSVAQGNGGFAAGTSEAALALAGRTAGVLALRDGLYAVCQAYNNGAIGQSAYALGLSQYGNLLVALTAHDPGAPGGTFVNAAAPTVSAPTINNFNNNPQKTGGGAGNPSNKNVARIADADDSLPLTLVADAPVPGGGGGGGGTQPPATPDAAIFKPNDSAAAALMVACISEYDPTRIGARDANGQLWYSGVLSEPFCRDYIARLSHRLAAAMAANNAPAKPPTVQKSH